LTDSHGAEIPLIAIVGPTASGKTDLALAIGEHLPIEIIGADSRQVYRLMDIGTAKPTKDQQAVVSHHLVDVVLPNEEFHLAEYLRLARRAITEIKSKGRIPVLVGGTAQYVWALLEGWSVPEVPPDPALREQLLQDAQRNGSRSLHKTLAQVDPDAAMSIHPNNTRRIIRALELFEHTGRSPSLLLAQRTPRTDTFIFGIHCPRADLYERIDLRVDAMFQLGLVEEVRHLLDLGYAPSLPSMSGIGYTQVTQLLSGNSGFGDAVARVKTATHRLARQQCTWFRTSDPRIRWIYRDGLEDILHAVEKLDPLAQGTIGVSA
jgi:tRNA dimethylallyltransferase